MSYDHLGMNEDARKIFNAAMDNGGQVIEMSAEFRYGQQETVTMRFTKPLAPPEPKINPDTDWNLDKKWWSGSPYTFEQPIYIPDLPMYPSPAPVYHRPQSSDEL